MNKSPSVTTDTGEVKGTWGREDGAPEKGIVGPMCQEGGDEKHRQILTEVGGRYLERKNEGVGKRNINDV